MRQFLLAMVSALVARQRSLLSVSSQMQFLTAFLTTWTSKKVPYKVDQASKSIGRVNVMLDNVESKVVRSAS